MEKRIREAYEAISKHVPDKPLVGLILGSGLGEFAKSAENAVSIPYSDIPGFPVSTVAGHASALTLGRVRGVPAVIMQGRFHCYEGYTPQETAMPVWVMKLLGVKYLLVTNAAGGISRELAPGDLMVITDHINFAGLNPLAGPNISLGTRFPDMSRAYSPKLIKELEKGAEKGGVSLKRGVYAMMGGPSFETPAEIRMLRALGADAVGMSTVPEVIAAGHCGIEAAGVSCITNYAAGITENKLTHEEVFETAQKAKESFIALLNGFFDVIGGTGDI